MEPGEYGGDPAAGAAAAERELKQMLEGLAQHLFGSGTEVLCDYSMMCTRSSRS